MLMKFLLYLPLLLLCPLLPKAQLTENFTDADFTANPIWASTAGDWAINAALQLQSNNTTANAVFYINTPNTLATNAEWDFYAGLKFATSGSNYVDVFLIASAADLAGNTVAGYFVRIGNTADEICLYRKDAGKTAVKIIDGADGIVSSTTDNRFKIKVTRDALYGWVLSRDITGTGSNYFKEGSATDSTYTATSYFGFLVKQSIVAGFAQKHFFDDIEIKPYAPDTTAPLIKAATVTAVNRVDVLFNEPMDKPASEAAAAYTVNNSIGAPVSAMVDAANSSLVHLAFATNFPGSINCTLTVNNVKDEAGNALVNGIVNFTYFAPYTPRQFDVVIDEIMADPTPVVSLPDNEWIELKNAAANAINLKGWKVQSINTVSGPMPDFVLLPDSFVIVCTGNAAAAMSAFGKTIAITSFPSLDNTGGQLSLISPQGNFIHTVRYTAAWYQNELKKDGGWSLEMTDTNNPCAGIANWKASTDLKGGSPGKKNATSGVNPDKKNPALLRAYAPDSVHIILVFDEPLDSLKASAAAAYTVSDGTGSPVKATAVSPVFDNIALTLSKPLNPGKIYTVTVSGVTDCTGNLTGVKNTARVGISAVADSLDLVINEILFNPPSNGSDFVELYNRSNKIINLKQTYIANRNTTNTIGSITPISAENYLLFPQDFIVLSADVEYVKSAYINQNPDALLAVPLPAFNNDKGNVIILNAQGNITDEVDYNDYWHFKLLSNTEGISLERIDYNGASSSADNWHSAAASAGYGTPTYKNSQYRIDAQAQGAVKWLPEIVSPDNDGQDDFATMEYQFPEPGYIVSITIFDASGRPVRYLQRNALCGTKGIFRWDGLDDKNQQLAVGIYIAYTAVFNLKGLTKYFKTPIVLARRK